MPRSNVLPFRRAADNPESPIAVDAVAARRSALDQHQIRFDFREIVWAVHRAAQSPELQTSDRTRAVLRAVRNMLKIDPNPRPMPAEHPATGTAGARRQYMQLFGGGKL